MEALGWDWPLMYFKGLTETPVWLTYYMESIYGLQSKVEAVEKLALSQVLRMKWNSCY